MSMQMIVSIDTNIHHKWKNVMEGSWASKIGANPQLISRTEKQPNLTWYISIELMVSIDTNARWKIKEVNSQVWSSRTAELSEQCNSCLGGAGESCPLFQLCVFNIDSAWMAGESISQYVCMWAMYGSQTLRQENYVDGNEWDAFGYVNAT